MRAFLPGGSVRRARRRAHLLLLFALGGVVLAQGLATLYFARHPVYRDPLFASRLMHYQVRQRANPPTARTVILLGSSRFYNAMRVPSLENTLREQLGETVVVHNWYHFATGAFTSLFQWERLKRAGGRPDVVVVEVVPAFLSDLVFLNKINTERLPSHRLHWEDVPLIRRYHPERTGVSREVLQARLLPLYWHRLEFLTHFVPRLVPPSHRCYRDYFLETHRDPPIKDYSAALKRAEESYAWCLRSFRLGTAELDILRDLLTDLRAAGVRAVVITMPEGPVFRSWYQPGAWEEIESAVTKVCEECDASFVNARDWLDGEQYFFDSHHTTEDAGKRFSRRLAGEVLAPLLRGIPSDPHEGSGPPVATGGPAAVRDE